MGCCSYSPLREPKASSHFPGLQRNWSWKPLHLMHSLSQCPENKSCFLSGWHNCIWKRWSSQMVALVRRSANRIAKVTLTIQARVSGFLSTNLRINNHFSNKCSSRPNKDTKNPSIPSALHKCIFTHVFYLCRVHRELAIVQRGLGQALKQLTRSRAQYPQNNVSWLDVTECDRRGRWDVTWK